MDIGIGFTLIMIWVGIIFGIFLIFRIFWLWYWKIDKIVDLLTDYSHLVRKALAKKIHMKFLPKISFISDKSFDYAEKIEKLIKESHEYKYEK